MSRTSASREAAPKRAKGAKRPKCPICDKPSSPDYRPFCSKACADIDLGRWLSGRYVVPGEAVREKPGEDED